MSWPVKKVPMKLPQNAKMHKSAKGGHFCSFKCIKFGRKFILNDQVQKSRKKNRLLQPEINE